MRSAARKYTYLCRSTYFRVCPCNCPFKDQKTFRQQASWLNETTERMILARPTELAPKRSRILFCVQQLAKNTHAEKTC